MSVGLFAQAPSRHSHPQRRRNAAAPQQPAPNPSNLGNDANGNPLRKALKTGHVSNYDESKVPPTHCPIRS